MSARPTSPLFRLSGALAVIGAGLLAVPVEAAPFGARADALTLVSSASGVEAGRPAGPNARAAIRQSASPDALGARMLEAELADSFAAGASAPESDALLAFYAARGFAPVWTDETGLTSKGARVADWLGTAADDGLDPRRYPAPRLSALAARSGEARAKAEARIALSVLRYARDAQVGTLEPRDVSRLFDLDVAEPDVSSVLADVASAEDAARQLNTYTPPHEGYRNLRRALIKLNADTAQPVVAIPPGPALRRGAAGPRVLLLRERLGLLSQGDIGGGVEDVFDTALDEAVRAYQRENGLSPDGVVGPQTLGLLNGEAGDKRAVLIANMERWRWMPRELGARHVLVNVPAFDVAVREREGDGFTASYSGRVVVGKPSNPTPLFSDEMEHIVTNPYWNVPYSIASKEMLPKLKRDPSYLSARGYDVITPSGKLIHSASVDWRQVSPRKLNYRFRQRPGRSNALGAVKFLFPNEHAVYLHDTNAKSLFGRAVRAFSHGCVRLHEPFDFAEALLAPVEALSGGGLKRTLGGKERWFNLPDHIPVHIAYFTARADGGGNLTLFGDVYGLDAKVREALAR